MQLGITLKLGAGNPVDIEKVQEVERLGYSQVWAGEAYGTDAVTPVTWVLARTTKIKAGTGIMQMQARTPTCAAMTAQTLQLMSGNRFLCGVGPSGPQVIEGWHGVAFGKPIQRTKEYIEIIRRVLKREAPLTYEGEQYRIPYAGRDASGLGKPLKNIVHGDPSLLVDTASITPAGLRCAGEVSDGTLPIFFSPEQPGLITDAIEEGMKKAKNDKTLADFDTAPYVRIRMGNDLEQCRDALRPELALYIGGMGARSKNFYNDLAKRLGYEKAAKTIQNLYLDGKKKEAEAAVPVKLIDEISLVGPGDRIKDRMQAWKDCARNNKVRTMVLTGGSIEALRVAAEAAL